MEQATRISISEVSKIYKNGTNAVEAVKNFTESVKDGEFICVVGASGCGKTTLLWCLSGLHPATSGEVHIDGELLEKPLPDRIGMVFQDSNLLPWRTLIENIELPFEIKKAPVNHELIEELLEVAGLKGFENSYPGELSGGMKQRGSIVRALAQDPEVLLMDEPFGALDAFTREEMNLFLLKVWERKKKTIVFVTHSISEAIFLADRVWVMSPRPGRLSRVVNVEFARPRQIDLQFEPDFIEILKSIREDVEGSKSLKGNK
ncbi:MAG TPA: ABC transporter ATP-binding protein [Candidatus Paceibacterota bacterium]|nr:ABC transporter ATP-binding protein [Candidatus Paceibacterota bacterium]